MSIFIQLILFNFLLSIEKFFFCFLSDIYLGQTNSISLINFNNKEPRKKNIYIFYCLANILYGEVLYYKLIRFIFFYFFFI